MYHIADFLHGSPRTIIAREFAAKVRAMSVSSRVTRVDVLAAALATRRTKKYAHIAETLLREARTLEVVRASLRFVWRESHVSTVERLLSDWHVFPALMRLNGRRVRVQRGQAATVHVIGDRLVLSL